MVRRSKCSFDAPEHEAAIVTSSDEEADAGDAANRGNGAKPEEISGSG